MEKVGSEKRTFKIFIIFSAAVYNLKIYFVCLKYQFFLSEQKEGYRVMMIFMLFFQRLNFIDVATGSLGQGLSVAAGMAYTGKYFDKSE